MKIIITIFLAVIFSISFINALSVNIPIATNYTLVNTNNSLTSNYALDSDKLDGQHGSYYTGYCDTIFGNALHLNQDNWGLGNNWLYWINPNLYFNESKLSTIYYNATQSVAVTGTIDGGTLVNTQHPDGGYDGVTLNFSEVSGSPGLDLRMNFTGVDDFNRGIMRYKTSNLAGNFPIIQVWNYDESVWEDYPALTTSLGFATIEQSVFDNHDHILNGIVQMRLYKASNGNTNNKYYVDWVTISKGYGTPSGEEVDPVFESWLNNPILNYNLNLTDKNITTTSYGFFGWLGSSISRITKGWFTDIDTSYLNATNVNATNLHINNIGANACVMTNGSFCRNNSGLYYQSGTGA